jgi:Cysteine rich repeat
MNDVGRNVALCSGDKSMKYYLSGGVALGSSEWVRSRAPAKKWQLSTPKLLGVVVLMAVGAYDDANVARAQGAPDRQAIQQACAADYQSLCSGVQPGGGRIIACLQQNAAKLSPPCQKAMAGTKKSQ